MLRLCLKHKHTTTKKCQKLRLISAKLYDVYICIKEKKNQKWDFKMRISSIPIIYPSFETNPHDYLIK